MATNKKKTFLEIFLETISLSHNHSTLQPTVHNKRRHYSVSLREFTSCRRESSREPRFDLFQLREGMP